MKESQTIYIVRINDEPGQMDAGKLCVALYSEEMARLWISLRPCPDIFVIEPVELHNY